ncbi:MAG: hypothetical protein F6K55_03270 [Moorea sp. SIO4A3]|nr:hypothetical protein [Moorena sp. SIO4A3]
MKIKLFFELINACALTLTGATIVGLSTIKIQVNTTHSNSTMPTVGYYNSPAKIPLTMAGTFVMALGIIGAAKGFIEDESQNSSNGNYQLNQFINPPADSSSVSCGEREVDSPDSSNDQVNLGSPKVDFNEIDSFQSFVESNVSSYRQPPKDETLAELINSEYSEDKLSGYSLELWQDKTTEKELPYYKTLVLENSLVIIGFEKGSGKTTLAEWIIAQHIKKGHKVIVSSFIIRPTEFIGLQTAKPIKDSNGQLNDFSQIEEAIDRFCDESDRRRSNASEIAGYSPFDEDNWVIVFDEFTGFGNKIDPARLDRLFETCVQWNRQMNMTGIFISHGFTADTFGGHAMKGKHRTIANGFTCIELSKAITDPNTKGGKRPSGKAKKVIPQAQGNYLIDKEFSYPTGNTKNKNYPVEDIVKPIKDFRPYIKQYQDSLANIEE